MNRCEGPDMIQPLILKPMVTKLSPFRPFMNLGRVTRYGKSLALYAVHNGGPRKQVKYHLLVILACVFNECLVRPVRQHLNR